MENLYFAFPKASEGYAEFKNSFITYHGETPKFPTARNAYDAVMIIAQALEKTNLEGGEKLRDAIAATKDYPGVSLDSMSFDEKGFLITPDDAFEIRTVRDGDFVTVSPPYEGFND